MPAPVSPKITAVLIVGFLASVILPNVGLVTPEMLSSLGSWAPFWYGVAVTGISAAAGWWKKDPLREAGKAAQTPGTGRHAADAPRPAQTPNPDWNKP